MKRESLNIHERAESQDWLEVLQVLEEQGQLSPCDLCDVLAAPRPDLSDGRRREVKAYDRRWLAAAASIVLMQGAGLLLVVEPLDPEWAYQLALSGEGHSMLCFLEDI